MAKFIFGMIAKCFSPQIGAINIKLNCRRLMPANPDENHSTARLYGGGVLGAAARRALYSHPDLLS